MTFTIKYGSRSHPRGTVRRLVLTEEFSFFMDENKSVFWAPKISPVLETPSVWSSLGSVFWAWLLKVVRIVNLLFSSLSYFRSFQKVCFCFSNSHIHREKEVNISWSQWVVNVGENWATEEGVRHGRWLRRRQKRNSTHDPRGRAEQLFPASAWETNQGLLAIVSLLTQPSMCQADIIPPLYNNAKTKTNKNEGTGDKL